MSKYDELGRYLRERRTDEIPMTFGEIERVTGEKLPPSAHKHRPWWSNNPRNSVMTQIWLDAGFKTARVDMGGEKLVFKRMRSAARPNASAHAAESASEAPKRHPALGALKGLLQVMPGTDLTQPTGLDWGKGN